MMTDTRENHGNPYVHGFVTGDWLMPPLLNPSEWIARNRTFLSGVLLGVALACAAFTVWLIWWI